MKREQGNPTIDNNNVVQTSFYLVYDEAQMDNGNSCEIDIDELEEIDKISQMALDIPDEETPVFLTCT